MAKRKGIKRTDNELLNTTQKTKEWATRTPLKSEVNLCISEASTILSPNMTSVVLLLNDMDIIWDGNYVWHQYV